MATSKVRSEPPLVVIVGPTASGKTGLAIRLAKKFGGEIICADSRTIYKGMDIGTAKPSAEERNGVKHWAIDLVNPDEKFTVKRFQDYAYQKINEIRSRGKIPFLVGGTGLYIDAVIFHYNFPTPPDKERRSKLESMSIEELSEYCINNNIKLPINSKNKRHLMHAAFQKDEQEQRQRSIEKNTIVVGIATEKAILDERISDRTELMFDRGVIEEAKAMGERYGWEAEAMKSNIYRSLQAYFSGAETLEATKENFRMRDRQLAKRQMTWFRRNKDIRWLSLEESYKYIARRLGSLNKP